MDPTLFEEERLALLVLLLELEPDVDEAPERELELEPPLLGPGATTVWLLPVEERLLFEEVVDLVVLSLLTETATLEVVLVFWPLPTETATLDFALVPVVVDLFEFVVGLFAPVVGLFELDAGLLELVVDLFVVDLFVLVAIAEFAGALTAWTAVFETALTVLPSKLLAGLGSGSGRVNAGAAASRARKIFVTSMEDII